MDEKEKLKASLDQIHAEESLKTSTKKYLFEKVYFKEKIFSSSEICRSGSLLPGSLYRRRLLAVLYSNRIYQCRCKSFSGTGDQPF